MLRKKESGREQKKNRPGEMKRAGGFLLKCTAVSIISLMLFSLTGCSEDALLYKEDSRRTEEKLQDISMEEIPAYDGSSPYVEINHNIPAFSEDEITDESFEEYSPLDELGRCGAAVASVGTDIMPTEERGAIGMIRPSGWHTVKYEGIDGLYLYNRCHLIGFQLTGENANEENLITGTRYLNVVGMLPFEDQVADYVQSTGNHVMYRVTPVFYGDNLVADGVEMEALSVEDGGEGVSFHVFCYNIQPGIEIDYEDGESRKLEESDRTASENKEKEQTDPADIQEYVLNTNTKKFHTPDCESVSDIKTKNKKVVEAEREKLIEEGYAPCGRCNP